MLASQQLKLRTTLWSTIVCKLTDLDGAYSLILDKHAGVVKFVPAYDPLATLSQLEQSPFIG
jgi:hypothetical protein